MLPSPCNPSLPITDSQHLAGMRRPIPVVTGRISQQNHFPQQSSRIRFPNEAIWLLATMDGLDGIHLGTRGVGEETIAFRLAASQAILNGDALEPVAGDSQPGTGQGGIEARHPLAMTDA